MRLSGILVDPGWLSAHVRRPGLVVADVRWSPTGGPSVTKRGFEEDGHIPGAVQVDVDRDLAGKPFTAGPGRHPLPDPERFAATMTSLGVDDDTLVIAYDDVGGSVAARLWWMLWSLDHQVAVLDGGCNAWLESGGQLERGPAKKVLGAAPFTVRPWPADRIVGASAVASTIRTGSAPVLDARAAERYRAEAEPIDPVAGHIPGARSAPWDENLREDGRFLPPESLKERYAALGVTGDATIVYCGSGVTSCHDLLALRLAGFGDARLYEGSWSGWSRDPEAPVAIGPQPGEL